MTAPPPPQVFRWPIRVYYEDTDVSGVVYHANYLRYFERARTEWLRALGYSQERLRVELGIAFTMADIAVQFLQPARLDDELFATVALELRRRVSMNFTQNLIDSADNSRVLSIARARVVCVDADNFRLRALPEILTARIPMQNQTDNQRPAPR